jgi:hypothetical protein
MYETSLALFDGYLKALKRASVVLFNSGLLTNHKWYIEVSSDTSLGGFILKYAFSAALRGLLLLINSTVIWSFLFVSVVAIPNEIQVLRINFQKSTGLELYKGYFYLECFIILL